MSTRIFVGIRELGKGQNEQKVDVGRLVRPRVQSNQIDYE